MALFIPGAIILNNTRKINKEWVRYGDHFN
jgi:hypothetical protein